MDKEDYYVLTGEVKMLLNTPQSIISQKGKLAEFHFPYIDITLATKIYCENCARKYVHFAVNGVTKEVKSKTRPRFPSVHRSDALSVGVISWMDVGMVRRVDVSRVSVDLHLAFP